MTRRELFLESAAASSLPMLGAAGPKITGIDVMTLKVNVRGSRTFRRRKTNKGFAGLGEASTQDQGSPPFHKS